MGCRAWVRTLLGSLVLGGLACLASAPAQAGLGSLGLRLRRRHHDPLQRVARRIKHMRKYLKRGALLISRSKVRVLDGPPTSATTSMRRSRLLTFC